jgi:hypothetical protein
MAYKFSYILGTFQFQIVIFKCLWFYFQQVLQVKFAEKWFTKKNLQYLLSFDRHNWQVSRSKNTLFGHGKYRAKTSSQSTRLVFKESDTIEALYVNNFVLLEVIVTIKKSGFGRFCTFLYLLFLVFIGLLDICRLFICKGLKVTLFVGNSITNKIRRKITTVELFNWTISSLEKGGIHLMKVVYTNKSCQSNKKINFFLSNLVASHIGLGRNQFSTKKRKRTKRTKEYFGSKKVYFLFRHFLFDLRCLLENSLL